MDFRVEVSLWNRQGNNSGQQAAQPNVAANFSDKLGLKSQSQAQEQPSDTAGKGAQQDSARADAPLAEAALLPSETGADQAQSALLQQRQLAQLPGVVELYPLGMRAGQHLSHLPYGFLQSAEQAAQLYGSMAVDQTAPAVTHAPAPQQTAEQAQISADAFARSSSHQVSNTEGGEAVSAEQLSLYLAQKWPQRSSLVLPRGNGIELLIRDYHLAADEQESLVAELLVRMHAQPAQPEQIWINGRCVWQRSSSLSIQGEKQHGY
jgi:hypothetical protein